MLNPTFIAHRGYASAFPENTLVAIEAARQSGAEYVEVDIQLSADLVPVLFHDRDLKRLCQQDKAIHDYTFTELEQFNVSDSEKFSEMFADNKITSLQNFVEYLKQYSALNAFIELKSSMIDQFGEVVVLEKILPFFAGMQQQVSFISYNQKILKKIHDETGFATGIVIDDWEDYDKHTNWKPEWLFCSVEGLPKENSRLNIKSKIVVFEVGNIGIVKHLLAKNISYFETFRIKEMIQAFSL